MATNNIVNDVCVDRYLEAHKSVLKVMDAPMKTVEEYVADYREELSDVEYADLMHNARELARSYALRDVMTRMACGQSIDEALESWMADNGPLGMAGETSNAVSEAHEDLFGDDEWEEAWGEDDE